MPPSLLSDRLPADLDLKVELLATSALKAGRALRKHSKAQIRRIARSIADHGFVVPLTVYGDNRIAAGTARWEAAKLLGLATVPCIRLSHLTDDQARLFAIADNKLSEGVEWDFAELKIEFEDIIISSPTLDLDRSGFCHAERDIIFARHDTDAMADLDDDPLAERVEKPVSRIGDIFVAGDHRLACGDATSPEIIEQVVNGARVRTLLSDLPYNVRIDGHVSGNGKVKHDEFAMASGEMSPEQFTAFLTDAIRAAQGSLIDGALAYLFMDWRHLNELNTATSACGLSPQNLLVWNKGQGGQGAFYRSAHELVGLFKHGTASHINNVQLGRHGRNRTNVLTYPGMVGFGRGRAKALATHPTVKPTALVADLILDSSLEGDTILDPFGGSGTTLIAAEKVKRRACLVEIDPGFVDVTVRRFETMTGTTVMHEQSGLSFAALAAQREKEN